VWLGLGEGGGTAGSTYVPLELTNVSSHTCRLFGFPGVSGSDGRQLGRPAQRDRSVPARRVTLARGATAHVLLRITDVSNLPASQCRPATATGLKVYPPDQRASRFVPFSFRACSARGAGYLSIRPVEPGVGVPGYTAL
jgi:hypothetical protein